MEGSCFWPLPLPRVENQPLLFLPRVENGPTLVVLPTESLPTCKQAACKPTLRKGSWRVSYPQSTSFGVPQRVFDLDGSDQKAADQQINKQTSQFAEAGG